MPDIIFKDVRQESSILIDDWLNGRKCIYQNLEIEHVKSSMGLYDSVQPWDKE